MPLIFSRTSYQRYGFSPAYICLNPLKWISTFRRLRCPKQSFSSSFISGFSYLAASAFYFLSQLKYVASVTSDSRQRSLYFIQFSYLTLHAPFLIIEISQFSSGHLLATSSTRMRSLLQMQPSLLLSQNRKVIKQMCYMGISLSLLGILAQFCRVSTSENYRKSMILWGRGYHYLKYRVMLSFVTAIQFQLSEQPPIFLTVSAIDCISSAVLMRRNFFFWGEDEGICCFFSMWFRMVSFGSDSWELLGSSLISTTGVVKDGSVIIRLYSVSSFGLVLARLIDYLFREVNSF